MNLYSLTWGFLTYERMNVGAVRRRYNTVVFYDTHNK